MTICVKTPKGIEEVTKRSEGVNLKARRLLIMVDGSRDFAGLSAMFPSDDCLVMLEKLLEDGYITRRSVSKPTEPAPPAPARDTVSMPTPGMPSGVPAELDAAKRYEMARNFMINTTSAFLGVFGSSLRDKIEEATCLEDLQRLFTTWRDAILLTPDGKKQAYELEHRLASLLS
jgi:hypothetical protein